MQRGAVASTPDEVDIDIDIEIFDGFEDQIGAVVPGDHGRKSEGKAHAGGNESEMGVLALALLNDPWGDAMGCKGG
jgi:hypothetical protein